MKEVKEPSKKPFIYYYIIVLIVLMLLNALVFPSVLEEQVSETDYGTFMTMTEEKNIGLVQIQDNQIVFTDKAEKEIYKTGRIFHGLFE